MGIGPTSQCETSIDQHEFSQAGNIYLTAEGVRGNRDRRTEELFFLKRLLPTQSEGERKSPDTFMATAGIIRGNDGTETDGSGVKGGGREAWKRSSEETISDARRV